MACDFNATTSKAEHTTADLGLSGGLMTLYAWIFTDGLGEGNNGGIIALDEARNSISLQHVSTANLLEFKAIFTGADGEWTVACTDGQWNGVALSYDANDATNLPVARVNRVAVTVNVVVSATLAFTAPNTGICIGARTAGTNTWDGMLGEIMVHDVIHAAGEMDQQITRPGSVRRGLKGHWRLRNETDLQDLSGNGFNLTGSNLAYRVGGPPTMPIFAGWGAEQAAAAASGGAWLPNRRRMAA